MGRRTFLCVVMLAVAAMLFSGACAQGTEEVPMVSFGKISVPVDTETVEMGKVTFERPGFEVFCDFLSQLPNLKHVEMFSSKINAEQIDTLTRLFPDVAFDWTMWVGNHLVRTDAVVFSTLHYDNERRHTEEDFALLRYCPSLLALDIGHNNIGDLSFLYDLPNLQVLILSDDRIACDLTPIASLTNLVYLEMFDNHVEDITPLAELKNLRHLNLSFNNIQDLTPLAALTQMEHLWIAWSTSYSRRVPASEEVIQLLKDAMPNAKINTTAGAPDGGGWTDFKARQRVKRMFSSRKYLPLED